MIRYFVARGETAVLDEAARRSLRGSFVGLGDGITHYELSGPADGELAVLVPGLTIPLSYWDGLAARLHARGMRTLAYSAYGRGYSDRVRATYDEALFVRQLEQLRDALGLPGPVHLVGASMGALIAMAAVVRDPDAVRTLTLAGPAGLSGGAPPLIRRLRGGVPTATVGRYLGRRGLLAHLSHNVADPEHAATLTEITADAYRYEGSIYALFSTLIAFPLAGRQSLYRDVARRRVPTLLLWGGDDAVTPIGVLPEARALLGADATVAVKPGAGHMLALEHPEWIAEELGRHVLERAPR